MLRQSAKTKHDQALPKLMNNSVFGKTCEDPSKYQEVKLVCGEHSVKRMQRWQNQQTFKTVHLINSESALVMMKKKNILFG